jgi:hypothetical protein
MREIVESSSMVVWLNAVPDSRYKAYILSAHFPCKRFYEIDRAEFERFPLRGASVVLATDLALSALKDAAAGRGSIVVARDELGLRYLLLRPQREAGLSTSAREAPFAPFTRGCP